MEKQDMPPEEWKIITNDKYQKVISSILNLSIASFALPVIIVKNNPNLEKNKSVLEVIPLDGILCWIYWSITILCGLLFYYLSAKWIKTAYNVKTLLSSNTIEKLMDICFWTMNIFFFLGIWQFINFSFTYK